MLSGLLLLTVFQSAFASIPASGFSDVQPTNPYYEAINSLKADGIIQGYPDGTFKPDQPVNRVEALKIISLGAKIEVPESSTVNLTFNDIKNGEWYIKYLSKAVELNIVQGYTDGTFKPTQTVNLVENLKMLINTKKINVVNIRVPANPYADAISTEWYAKYVQYAKDRNWLTPDSENMIYPSQGMTRGKLAQLIYNSQKTIADQTQQQTQQFTQQTSQTSAVKFEGRYIDAHTHIGLKGMSLKEIIKKMDAEGIDLMVIMMTPTAIYDGTPPSDSGIPDASETYPKRFISLYGGEAITLLDSVVAKGSYTQAEEDQYTALLEDAMKSGKYRGFGEIALRHVLPDDKGADVAVPGDHPWMFIMSDIAAKYDVPIDIHMDIVAGEDNGITGLEKLLDHNKKTKIIWSHTAWSRTNYKSASVELMRQLLEKHPNLYSSIKIQTDTAFMDENNKIKSEWLTLFKDYSERFMVGSDIKPGVGKSDEFNLIIRHRDFLEQLPPEILKPIERDNAKKLFKIN